MATISKNQKIGEVMHEELCTLPASSTLADAACAMRDRNIGCVVVVSDSGTLEGMLTDRDIVVRGIAEGHDPKSTSLATICSHEVTKLHEDDLVDNALELMRRKAIRRIPVVRSDRPVGIVSLGDLASLRDPKSVLGEISTAPSNR